MLSIFDKIRSSKKEFHSLIAFDFTGTEKIREKLHQAGRLPETIRLPYSPMIMGVRVGIADDIRHVDEFAFIAVETSANQIEFHPYTFINYELCRPSPLHYTVLQIDSPHRIVVRYDARFECSDNLSQLLLAHSNNAAMCLALLSAENICLMDCQPKFSRQVRRQRERSGQILTYKVLAINPGRKKNPLPISGSESVNIPAHWVRGNFAHYDARPLFGRYRGNFWRPAHMRGDPDNGFTQKDYALSNR